MNKLVRNVLEIFNVQDALENQINNVHICLKHTMDMINYVSLPSLHSIQGKSFSSYCSTCINTDRLFRISFPANWFLYENDLSNY